MTKVYLDKNIYIGIDKGQIKLMDIYKVLGTSDVIFLYSDEIIFEVLKSKYYNELVNDLYISKILDTIYKITSGKFLSSTYELEKNYEKVIDSFFNPILRYNELIEDNIYRLLFNELEKKVYLGNKINMKYIKEKLLLSSKQLNNLKPNLIFNHIENKTKGSNLNLNLLLDDSELSDKIYILILYLNHFGYHQDKQNYKSELALAFDAGHLIKASYCNVFISKDNNLIKKAEAIYYYLNIKTKIINLNTIKSPITI